MAEKEEVDDESSQFQSVQITSIDNSSQTGLEETTECEPLVISGGYGEVEDDPYHDAYRNGNFGIRRGRINFTRAKRWSIAHVISALIMTMFTLPCAALLGDRWSYMYGVGYDLRQYFIAITILCCIFGLTMSFCSLYLLDALAKIRRPLFLLLFVRLLALLELLFLVTGISLTIAVAGNSNEESIKILCSFLIISMLIEVIVAGSWLFHWWKCCDGCESLKYFCIFEPGEPLAPGVSDPPTGIIHECAYVCWSIYKIDWSII